MLHYTLKLLAIHRKNVRYCGTNAPWGTNRLPPFRDIVGYLVKNIAENVRQVRFDGW
jgi:hypothetical protein